jgi:hypothetical protein
MRLLALRSYPTHHRLYEWAIRMRQNPELPKSMPLNALQTWPIVLLLTSIGGYVDLVGYCPLIRFSLLI